MRKCSCHNTDAATEQRDCHRRLLWQPVRKIVTLNCCEKSTDQAPQK